MKGTSTTRACTHAEAARIRAQTADEPPWSAAAQNAGAVQERAARLVPRAPLSTALVADHTHVPAVRSSRRAR